MERASLTAPNLTTACNAIVAVNAVIVVTVARHKSDHALTVRRRCLTFLTSDSVGGHYQRIEAVRLAGERVKVETDTPLARFHWPVFVTATVEQLVLLGVVTNEATGLVSLLPFVKQFA